MADPNAEQSTVDSAKQDIAGAIRMGQSTARSAKTISKAAAEAASGNVAGAVVTVAKDPETLKKLLIILMLPVLIFSLLGVFFLYALPVSIFEGCQSYCEEIAEDWREHVYDGGGDITFKKIVATIKVGGDVTGDFFKSIWNGIKGLFTKDAGGDAGSTNDTLSDTGIELQVTQVESSEKQTLQNKITACINKIDARSAEIQDAINENSDKIASAISAQLNSSGEYDELNVQVQVSRNSMSQDGALQLLSLYTVQQAASVQDMKLSDLMRWLGWYDSRKTGTTTFTLGGLGVDCEVKTWNGTFLPQYLMEQRKQEKYQYDEVKTNFDDMMCAAVDMLLVVDCPYIGEVPVQKTVTYETHRGPDGEEIQTEKTIGTVYYNITIMPRSAASLSNLAGLWEGNLKDKQKPLNFNNGLDSGGSAGGSGGGDFIMGDPSVVGSGDLLWPLSGITRTSSPFGYRNCPFHGRELHSGVDIPAPSGTPILAADAGTVTLSTYGSSYGNNVKINHGNGMETRYCHMSSRAVSAGQVVAKGEVIGYVGSTGNSTGAHLHFMVMINGTPTDPMKGYNYTYP